MSDPRSLIIETIRKELGWNFYGHDEGSQGPIPGSTIADAILANLAAEGFVIMPSSNHSPE